MAMYGGTRTTRGAIRPARPVSRAWARLPASSPWPPCWYSGEVAVVFGAAGLVLGAGAGFFGFCVAVLLGAAFALVSLFSLSPPQPATAVKAARKASTSIKRRPRLTDDACEEMHNGLDTLDTR